MEPETSSVHYLIQTTRPGEGWLSAPTIYRSQMEAVIAMQRLNKNGYHQITYRVIRVTYDIGSHELLTGTKYKVTRFMREQTGDVAGYMKGSPESVARVLLDEWSRMDKVIEPGDFERYYE